MPRVHVYCRVSSAKQEDGYSLDTQEAACRKWADERGYPVASVAREIQSGGDRHRPELDAMIDRLVSGDVFLCHALDRFSRDQMDTAVLVDRIERAGASLQLVTEDFEKSATGTFIRNAKSFAAQMELEKIRERTQRGRRARVASGKPIVSSRPPYGYDWNADKSGYVLDPVTAPIVRSIFDAYMSGATLRGVCATLEARGILSPTGRPQWTAAVIRETLMRSIYSGVVTAYATVSTRRRDSKGYDRRTATAAERVMLPGIAPAIVSPEEHALARSILERNKAASTRNNKNPEATLLRAGIVRCGHCGWVMGVKNPKPSAPGRSPVYQCNARGMRVHDCPQPSISASVIDDAVWANVCKVLRAPNIIAEELDKHRNDGGLERDLSALDKRLEGVATKQTNLARRVAMLSDDAAAPLMAELELLAAAKRTMAQDRADLLHRMADAEADAAKVRTLTEWAGHFAAKLDTATYEQKRQALEALGVQVHTYRVGACDAEGNPRPRWEMTMRPLALGAPVVYASAR